MKTLLAYWIILFLVSFAASVLGLSLVQSRLIEKEGWQWSVFRNHKFFDLYWHELRWFERLLIWPGLIAFLLTLIGATLEYVFGRT